MSSSVSDPSLPVAIAESVPRKVRLVLYIVTSLLLLVVSAMNATNGDWKAAAPMILGGLVPLLAAANLNPPTPVDYQGKHEADDGELLR